jgi:dynamin 1-like protein
VDLPGLPKNPTSSQQLEDMIVEYIGKDNCLILAVVTANTDLANSDTLKLARRVDPAGNRTIGVITKLDLMDTDTNVRDVFLGNTCPLQRGYIGVVCRSQCNADCGMDLSEALKNERAFFKNHPSYQDLAHRMGTSYLQRTIKRYLAENVRDKLVEFREKIVEKKRDAENTVKRCEKLDLRNGRMVVLQK